MTTTSNPKPSVAELLGISPDLPKPKPRKKFQVGIAASDGVPPRWDISLGGISFPVFNSRYDDDGKEYRHEGAIVELDTDQLKRIAQAVKTRIVRWNKNREGKKISAEIWDVSTTGFRLDPDDEPLYPYLILQEVKDETPAELRPTIFQVIDQAIESSKISEGEALADPKDREVRAKHKALRQTGSKVESAEV